MNLIQAHLPFSAINNAAVLGAGAWGTALALSLQRTCREVRLWARRPAHAEAMRAARQNAERLPGHPFPIGLTPTSSLEEALAGAGIVLLGAPSSATVALAASAARSARVGAPVIICAKGLGDSGALLSECVQKFWPGPVLVLSGPSFADEVAQRLPTIVTLAGPMPLAAKLADRFSDDHFVLCPSEDVVGVQVAAVFKNVAATLCGVSDGLALGANARAALMSEAMREAGDVIRTLGGRVETLLGPAGFGDFALTCTDAKSRNYSFGRELALGGSGALQQTREGAVNAASLVRVARQLGVETPLAGAVSDLLVGRCTPREAVEAAFAWRRGRAGKAARAA
jgi:glycerol-3-phosphate dehydrogenase (NAD(P)+)